MPTPFVIVALRAGSADVGGGNDVVGGGNDVVGGGVVGGGSDVVGGGNVGGVRDVSLIVTVELVATTVPLTEPVLNCNLKDSDPSVVVSLLNVLVTLALLLLIVTEFEVSPSLKSLVLIVPLIV